MFVQDKVSRNQQGVSGPGLNHVCSLGANAINLFSCLVVTRVANLLFRIRLGLGKALRISAT